MKTVAVSFPEKFSHVYSLTADGVEYINSGHKKAVNTPTDQSEVLTATHTTTLGCYIHSTMNEPDVQEGDA